jgi:transposase
MSRRSPVRAKPNGGSDLPVARLDGVERELRLLVDHREDLIRDRTAHQARLRWFLVELGIAEPKPRTLGQAGVLGDVERQLAGRPEPAARIGRDLVARIAELTRAINVLGGEIRVQTSSVAPVLLALPGCGFIIAAKVIGETSGISRFRSRPRSQTTTEPLRSRSWSGNQSRPCEAPRPLVSAKWAAGADQTPSCGRIRQR